MADSFKAGWPVAELLAAEKANGCSFLSAKQGADLYEMAYSTFVKRLKDFVQFGDYPTAAFRVSRRLNTCNREYWVIEIHPVLGIQALNKHFYPRLSE